MNWRALLTRQSQTWSEKNKPQGCSDIREYVRQWDALNNYVPPSYAWDNPDTATMTDVQS